MGQLEQARAANSRQKQKDKRVMRTEKALREAFFRLLGKCDYNKISVSALSREAGIDRKTFYLHYGSVEELTDAIMKERARDFTRSLLQDMQERTARTDTGRLRVAELFSSLCSEIADDMTHLRSQIRHIPVNVLLDKMPEMLSEAFVEEGRIVNGARKPVSKQCERLCAAFIGSGMVALFRYWILSHDDSVSAEDAAALVETLVFEGLQGLMGGMPAPAASLA